ncbi:MAG: adenosine-specific kinase [Thermoplasmata archaeon]|nr:adenosine-specific kinase [Thermoplasmata archaeon]
MEIKSVKIENPKEYNVILGQSHFIKTAEDIYEAMVNSVPNIKFGMAFAEASAHRKIRVEGTDETLKELAVKNIANISAGHTFIIFIEGAYPINVLNAIKRVPEVANIFCATANPAEVIIAESEQGRGILGVIDGQMPLGVESEEERQWRRDFLRKVGYKL